MFLGPRVTDTTKHSPTIRVIQAERVDRILHDLEHLRARARAYAEPDAIAAAAAEVPLPELSLQEEYFLQLEAQVSKQTTSSRGNAATNTHQQGCFSLDTPDKHGTKRHVDLIADNPTFESTDDEATKKHPLLMPDGQTFPARLAKLIDDLDSLPPSIDGSESRSDNNKIDSNKIDSNKIDPTLYSPDAGSGLGRNDGSLDPTLKPTPVDEQDKNDLKDAKTLQPILAEHLVALEHHIQEVIRFRDYLTRTLNEVNSSVRTHCLRWSTSKMTQYQRTTMFLKSRGKGSPLFEGIAADEDWPDPWAMLVQDRPHRGLLVRDYSSTDGDVFTGSWTEGEVLGDSWSSDMWTDDAWDNMMEDGIED